MELYGDGIKGEALVAAYLVKKGYRILAQRKSYKGVGEIDIVAMDGKKMVFVEVRERADDDFGHPLETVTVSKMKKIVRAAKCFLSENKNEVFSEIRFDIIAVIHGQVEHIEDAFWDKWY